MTQEFVFAIVVGFATLFLCVAFILQGQVEKLRDEKRELNRKLYRAERRRDLLQP